MRKWGYGLAGVLLLGLIVGVANPDTPQPQSSPPNGQTQAEAQETPTEAASVEVSDTVVEPENPTSSEKLTETTDPELVEESPIATSSPTPSSAQPAATAAPQDSSLAALLAQLVIEDEFPSVYDRDLFRHWIDADRDGCDARREVLILEALSLQRLEIGVHSQEAVGIRLLMGSR